MTRFGVRCLLLVTMALTGIMHIVTGFCDNLYAFIVIRAISFFFNGPTYALVAVYYSSILGPRYRPMGDIMIFFGTSIGVCLMACVAFLIPDWHHQFWFTGGLCLLSTLFGFCLPKLFQEAYEHGKLQKGRKYLTEFAELVDADLDLDVVKKFEKHLVATSVSSSVNSMSNENSLVSDPNLLLLTICGGYAYFGGCVIWMAFLLLQSGKIVNIYLDLIIGALVESVSYVILYFLVRTVYRKPLIFTLSGALAFLIMVALIFRAFGTGLSGTRFTSEIILYRTLDFGLKDAVND